MNALYLLSAIVALAAVSDAFAPLPKPSAVQVPNRFGLAMSNTDSVEDESIAPPAVSSGGASATIAPSKPKRIANMMDERIFNINKTIIDSVCKFRCSDGNLRRAWQETLSHFPNFAFSLFDLLNHRRHHLFRLSCQG